MKYIKNTIMASLFMCLTTCSVLFEQDGVAVSANEDGLEVYIKAPSGEATK